MKTSALTAVVCLALLSAGTGASETAASTSPAKDANGDPAQTVPKDRNAAWREDLATLATELPARHNNLFFKLSKAEFEAGVRSIDSRIPELTDDEIEVEMMKLVASTGDPNAEVYAVGRWGTQLPIGTNTFKDGVCVVIAHETYKHLLRCRVVRIGCMPIEEACKKLSEVIPNVHEALTMRRRHLFFSRPGMLSLLGIAKSPDSVPIEVVTPDGETLSLTLKAEKTESWGPPEYVFGLDPKTPNPLWMRNQDSAYWTESVEDGKAVYFQYNRCRSDKDNPIKDMLARLQKMLAQPKAERFVIDLRLNREGVSSHVLNPLIDWLAASKKWSVKGRTIVLIGRLTLGSAVLNAVRLRQDAHAVLMGEPTCGLPDDYGGGARLVLPNSQFRVYYSKYLVYPPEYPPLTPDAIVEPTSKEYYSGYDPVMEAALNYGH